MSATVTPGGASGARGRSVAAAILIGAVSAATLGLVVLTEGNAGAALAPALGVGFLFLLWKMPLRYTIYFLIYCGLTLQNPYEAFGHHQFENALTPVSWLLLANMNITTHIPAMNFTGLDVLMAICWIILGYRRATGSRIDAGPRTETARPMLVFALVSLLTNLVFWAWGLARGGDVSHSIWQIHKILEAPLFFFLCQAALRGAQDVPALGLVILASGLERAIRAVYVRQAIVMPGVDGSLGYATTHADSMLFVSALGILLALALEQRDRKAIIRFVLGTAALVAGMVANTRRLAWIEVAFLLVTFGLMTPRTWLKVKVGRAILYVLPLVVAYLAAGWGSTSGVFAPVKTVRSIIDSKSDSSTLWRDMENMNLIYTLGAHPFLGPGFGHPYDEVIPLPDISSAFEAYRFNPHNAVLGLWAFGGLIGFSGMWIMLAVCVFLASRAYRFSQRPIERAAALACIGIVIAFTNQAYGDLGISSWTGVFIIAPAMAAAGKLAVHTGAWPKVRRRGPRQVAEAVPVRAPAGAVAIP